MLPFAGGRSSRDFSAFSALRVTKYRPRGKKPDVVASGLITGEADDDPSGIADDSVARKNPCTVHRYSRHSF